MMIVASSFLCIKVVVVVGEQGSVVNCGALGSWNAKNDGFD